MHPAIPRHTPRREVLASVRESTALLTPFPAKLPAAVHPCWSDEEGQTPVLASHDQQRIAEELAATLGYMGG